ncbi:ABC transporter permease [Amycolatopsis tucumanensis]|uniref:ABC-2 type transporter transmembrane domain-containing protein n=1 Tax=Amycolatopsis tucumanensis TaxID=401106 RepID=A0ABP7JXJ8_9PSEU|nr:ABC transporter permease [Amycolatopsis tucumanensis]MCF6428506.1 ABC transporter permease [Amycolatopsis tucumanensis]
MTALPFVRRFIADYARNPVNLIVLVLVPVVFVLAAAGSIADAARVLGGGTAPAVQTATAGWAAGFLAAIAMYFQTRAARAADRRLVLAGLRPARLVGARVATGFALAVLVSAVSLLALEIRTGIETPGRVIAGTGMFAVIYLAIGALTGARVRNPVNGTVVILFVWILDVFFGPAFGSPDRVATRWLPTHFVTLWMVDLPSRHGGRPGDLGWALIWLVAAAALAWTVLMASSRVSRPAGRKPGQVLTGLRMGLVDYRRNPVLWALLIVVPVVFILLAKAITPQRPTVLSLVEGGRRQDFTFWLPDVHAGTMTPIATGALSTLAGLFIVLDSRAGDRRLSLAGFRYAALLATRLGVIAVAVGVITAAALAVTATVFDVRQWFVFVAASVLLGLTYALVGAILAPVFGRVAGVLIAFLVPFLDLGIAQSPMLRPEPAGWAHALPGYGTSRVLLDAGLTGSFDETGSLLIAVAWLAGLAVLAAVLLRQDTPTAGRSRWRSSGPAAEGRGVAAWRRPRPAGGA